jgi:hypothetical protein
MKRDPYLDVEARWPGGTRIGMKRDPYWPGEPFRGARTCTMKFDRVLAFAYIGQKVHHFIYVHR